MGACSDRLHQQTVPHPCEVVQRLMGLKLLDWEGRDAPIPYSTKEGGVSIPKRGTAHHGTREVEGTVCDNGLRGMADDALNSSDPLRSHGERPRLHLVWEYGRYQAGGRGRRKAHSAGGCFRPGPGGGGRCSGHAPATRPLTGRAGSGLRLGGDCPARVHVILSPVRGLKRSKPTASFCFTS